MPVETALKESRIRHLALSPPVRVPLGTGVGDVIRVMQRERSGCVLICEGDRLMGIFTERDLLTKLMGAPVDHQSPIEGFMTPRPKTLNPDDAVSEAVKLMHEGGYRDIPLVDEQGQVKGIITVRDIIEFLAEHFPAEVLNLPPRVHQTMNAPEGA